MASEMYNRHFFSNLAGGAQQSAEQVVPFVLSLPLKITSVLDVGCGTGSWAATFMAHGAEVVGVDGYAPADALHIPAERFSVHDLTNPLDLGRRFDLVVSLEVAEHLDARFESVFVDSLVRHAEAVLFSAAIPNQAGTGHVNLRWQSYWAGLFADRGYRLFDVVRPAFWDSSVEPWYKQNILLFACGQQAERMVAGASDLAQMPVVDLIHPEIYLGATTHVPLRYRLRRKLALRSRLRALRHRFMSAS